MDKSPAEEFFDSLSSLKDIGRLVSEGETEGQYLECKSPQSPKLGPALKKEFAEAISGFANSGGGVLIWGVSTTPHIHSGADVLTQVEPLGAVQDFKRQVDLQALTSVEPQTTSVKSKILREKVSDTRGIVITLVSPNSGDPVRSVIDGKFYLRTADFFSPMSYETIKRMFAGSAGPDLSALFADNLVQKQADSAWKIPIIVQNQSSAAARDTDVTVTFENENSCDSIKADGFKDQSHINPGKKIFMADVEAPVFRGKNILVGSFIVKMNKEKRLKRKLKLSVELFASQMRAKRYVMTVQLAKSGFSVKKVEEDFLY